MHPARVPARCLTCAGGIVGTHMAPWASLGRPPYRPLRRRRPTTPWQRTPPLRTSNTPTTCQAQACPRPRPAAQRLEQRSGARPGHRQRHRRRSPCLHLSLPRRGPSPRHGLLKVLRHLGVPLGVEVGRRGDADGSGDRASPPSDDLRGGGPARTARLLSSLCASAESSAPTAAAATSAMWASRRPVP